MKNPKPIRRLLRWLAEPQPLPQIRTAETCWADLPPYHPPVERGR